MEKTTKEEFEKYRKKHGWLLYRVLNPPTSPTHQEFYVTPMGVLVAAVYSGDGQYIDFAPIVPIVQQQPLRVPFLGKG